MFVCVLLAGSEPDSMYVVIDRHLITAQNDLSTLTAVQNLILLVNQRYEHSVLVFHEHGLIVN